ncbi:MAG: coxB [Nevskia sp.]|nr:coxB [Nevskia sp.]
MLSSSTKLSGVLCRLGVVCAMLFGSASAFAADTMDKAYWAMPSGVTQVSRDVFRLHMLGFYFCVAIGVVVFGVMFYSLFAFRRSKHPVPANFHESTVIEIIWTIIPFIILIGLAVPAAKTLIQEYDTSNSELTVKITGYQWKWQYEYVDQGVSFFSTLKADANIARQLHSGIDPKTVPNYLHDVDNYLVLPIGKKVRFLLTANDVIHGWWMPDLAIKKDAIPGYINEMWTKIDEVGVYRGQCTVLCGRDHGYMPIVVDARSAADYDAWLASKKGTQVASAAPATATDAAAPAAATPAPLPATPARSAVPSPASAPAQLASAAPAAAGGKKSKDDLMKAGATLYAGKCAACHQAAGQGMPPTFPSLVGDKVVTGPAAAHVSQILKGKNAMPPFGPMLSDDEIAAIATYERNSWGNHAGEVQADQVAALRGK